MRTRQRDGGLFSAPTPPRLVFQPLQGVPPGNYRGSCRVTGGATATFAVDRADLLVTQFVTTCDAEPTDPFHQLPDMSQDLLHRRPRSHGGREEKTSRHGLGHRQGTTQGETRDAGE